MINIEVEKNNNENNLSLLRRFTKRVQGSGILPRVRSIRYKSRKLSDCKTEKSIKRKKEVELLIKLGKFAVKERK
jgi:ribosomal protein S21